MSPLSESKKPQEVYVEAPEIKVPTDDSLPAGQVLAEQRQDEHEQLAPRFVP